MSYLASIVRRANGTAPLLRPRLPSRYEADPRTLAAPPAELHVGPEAPPPVVHVPPARLDAPSAGRSGVPPPVVEERPIVRTTMAKAPAPPQRTIVQSERVVERHLERVESHERIAAASTPPALPPLIEPRPLASPPASVQPAAGARDEPPDAPPLRALLMPAVTPPRDAARETHAPPASAPPHEQADAAPTIRVTIGRVDVRAVQAASPPARPHAAPGPAFTLDDYLRLRKDGRR